MTPFEIDILLHYQCLAGDYRNGDFSAPLLRPTLEEFVACGLLRRATGEQQYERTDATTVFVEALCAVPRPVQQWVIPSAACFPPATTSTTRCMTEIPGGRPMTLGECVEAEGG